MKLLIDINEEDYIALKNYHALLGKDLFELDQRVICNVRQGTVISDEENSESL